MTKIAIMIGATLRTKLGIAPVTTNINLKYEK